MKNRNVILMVAAIGIGLAAAFLTSQIGAKPAVPDTIKILVAKKELPVGTLLSEKKINDLVGVAEFPKGSLPPEVISDLAMLKEKRLTRTLRVGDKFVPGDLGAGKEIPIPRGMQMYTLRMDPVKAVAGFALPGSRVDLVLTEQVTGKTGKSKTLASVILRDMLVVAVDVKDIRPEGNQNAIATLTSVSLAVTPPQGQMLALAAKRGEITLMLRDPESTDRETLAPIDQLPQDSSEAEAETVVEAPKTVKIPVAKVEIESGKKITSANIDELFTEREFLDPAPANAVRTKEELLGKVVVKGIDPDQFVSAAALADKEPTPEVAPVVEAEPKADRHELTIHNGGTTNRHVYEGREGKFRLVTGQAPAPEATNQPPNGLKIDPLPAAPKPMPPVQSLPTDAAQGNRENF